MGRRDIAGKNQQRRAVLSLPTQPERMGAHAARGRQLCMNGTAARVPQHPTAVRPTCNAHQTMSATEPTGLSEPHRHRKKDAGCNQDAGAWGQIPLQSGTNGEHASGKRNPAFAAARSEVNDQGR